MRMTPINASLLAHVREHGRSRQAPECSEKTKIIPYGELAAQPDEISLISSGSITRRYTVCRIPDCKCHGDPQQRHGPYLQ
jgi:hypothetical protein